MLQQHDAAWMQRAAQVSLSRLLPRLENVIPDASMRQVFARRLHEQFPRLFSLLFQLYGHHYDFFFHLENTIRTAAEYYCDRPDDLLALDTEREQDRTWYASEKMIGATLYVDLFAGDFAGLRDKLPYLQELGVTYLHLMPVFRTPATNSDGGYAVSSYRETNPALGSMDDLRDLAADFRKAGISLVLDFIFNHTSNEHTWALAARSGDERYRNYYRVFPNRALPDQYEATLREIFPEQSPGNFTWDSDLQGWVWTTFYSFQWDLNYENPEVLTAMMGEMLFLANVGVEVLRLDAVAFVWKEVGTPSENLPQAHMIIQALNALVKVAAPGMIFKSEAIVHPDDVVSYIDVDESPISYNPTMMAMIWDALATRRADVLTYAMQNRYDLPVDCVWVNYVRVHDDIGWSMADSDMAQFGINGFDHRQFLNRFFTGQFQGSFAHGVGFGYNPVTQDLRIAGTAASLAGLEDALESEDEKKYRDAINRLLMIHSIILSTGGIPLLYIGDEIATLNDYSYRDDPEKALDARWVHRPVFNDARAADRENTSTAAGEIYMRLKHMIDVRKNSPALGGVEVTFFSTRNQHVFAYVRSRTTLCLHNFSEHPQTISRDAIAAHWTRRGEVTNMATGESVFIDDSIELPPYAYMWLV